MSSILNQSLGAFQGVQGATVLHRLARLYKTAIQGATQGATKCNIRCYTFKNRYEMAETGCPI